VTRRLVVPVLAIVLAAAGCSPGQSGSPPPASAGARTPLSVGLGFIPSVQFAPFYRAHQAGYYEAAGLEVTFQNKIDPDLIPLVGQGAIDIGLADGTSTIPAVANDIPIRYLATIYGTFPSIVFAEAGGGIEEAADLEGRKLGIPGRYGSSWIMLQALLRSAGLTPDDLEIVDFPDFTQGVAVQRGVVDAATGFANNEPVQLEQTGKQAVVLHVDDVVALPGPGLIAGTATLEAKRLAVDAFVSETLRAMREIAARPEVGLDAAIAAVPELGQNRELQLAILEATIETWSSPLVEEQGYGIIDGPGWEASVELLRELDVIDAPVPLEELVDDAFLADQ
jgi:NitT/TauT family transport system substrate-binding protein